MREPTYDTAEECLEHPGCIRGFKYFAANELNGLAGWWHLAWKGQDQGWEMTAPNGEIRLAAPRQGEHPVGWLVAAVPGLVLADIATAISDKGLFPPPR